MEFLEQSSQQAWGPFVIVALLFIVWFILMGALFIVLLRRYPLGNQWRSNPFEKETFGLPRGTLRGILTLSLLFSAVVFQIYALIYLEDDAKIAHFMTAFELMLAFYFGSKVMHHLSSTDKYKTREIASAVGTKKDDFYDPNAVG